MRTPGAIITRSDTVGSLTGLSLCWPQGRVAQRRERVAYNDEVAGSRPAAPTQRSMVKPAT